MGTQSTPHPLRWLSLSLSVSLWFLPLLVGTAASRAALALLNGWCSNLGGMVVGMWDGEQDWRTEENSGRHKNIIKVWLKKQVKEVKNCLCWKLKWKSRGLQVNRNLGCEASNHLSSIVSRHACIGWDRLNRKWPPVALFSASVLLLLLLRNCRLLWTGPVLWCAAVTARPCRNLQGAW